MSRTVVVTGASRGIGAQAALLAGQRGYDVCIVYRNDAASAARVAAAIPPGKAHLVQADVSNEGDVRRVFEGLPSNFGPVYGLVNSAGIMGAPTRIQNCDSARWREVFETNVDGTFLPIRAAIPLMSTAQGGTGGVIVNVSSMAAVLGGAGEYVHYAATKGAIESLTIGLSRELAGEGIRVNAVRPGVIDTELHSVEAGRVERLGKTVPIGRAGQASEVAEAILWLLSDAASYVTGAILPVSGGR